MTEHDGCLYYLGERTILLKYSKEYSHYEIPDSITINGRKVVIDGISPFAFQNSALKTLSFSDHSGVEAFPAYMIANSNIQKIYIPKFVRYIDLFALESQSLKEIIVDNRNSFYFSVYNALYSKNKQSLLFCPRTTEVFDLRIGIKVIQSNSLAFSKIKKIRICSSIKGIDGFAFMDCKNLTNVCVDANTCLKTIGISCFQNCIALKSIFFPGSVELIDKSAFSNCTQLENVRFPQNSKKLEIMDRAFNNTRLIVLNFASISIFLDCGCFA